MIDLSVILPFRNERPNLLELLGRLRAALRPLELRYELLFIDDGSTDGGADLLAEEACRDPRIKIIVLSRNFGQHIAGTAGIDIAAGRLVVWMDSDLQERPEDIPRLIEKQSEGFDVVYTRRTRRRQSPHRAWASHAFLWLLNRLVGLDVPPDRACLRLFTADVATALRRFDERNRYMGYLMPWAGYRCAEITVEMDPRRRGRSNYSFLKLVRLALAGLTSFSVAPLRLAAVFSVATAGLCACGVGYVLYRYFAYGFAITGWASLIIAVLVLHAFQFAVLAIVGEYVGLTYTESKRRPLYLCARAINLATNTPRVLEERTGAVPRDPQMKSSPPTVRATSS